MGATNEATDTLLMDARYNWWGDVHGPSGIGWGEGDPILTEAVAFAPWLTRRYAGSACEVHAAVLSGMAPALVSISFVTAGASVTASASAALEHNLGLIVTDFEEDQFIVYLGNGDGTFRRFRSYGVGDGPVAVAVGDFDRDGRTDVVVVNMLSESLTLAYGHGDGTFGPMSEVSLLGRRPRAVTVADFDRDGLLDLAVAHGRSHEVELLFGRSDGRFGRGRVIPLLTGRGPSALAAADFNRDGLVDLIVAHGLSGNVTLLLGDGRGGFGEAGAFDVGEDPIAISVTDLEGDGDVDVVTANAGEGTISVLFPELQGRRLRFVGRKVPVGGTPLSLVSGGFIEGQSGVVVADLASRTLSVFMFTDVRRSFMPMRSWVVLDPVALTSGDFTNDGQLDVVILGAERTLTTLVNEGRGRFRLVRGERRLAGDSRAPRTIGPGGSAGRSRVG